MSENIKKVSIDIWITELKNSSNLYQKWNNHNLHEDFIENKEDKKHNMSSHTKWFNQKIRLNHSKEEIESINKWKVCFVNYWMNVWTEINWIRPSIILKNSSYTYWEDIVVIPMTSYSNGDIDKKSKDEFDIEIKSSNGNWLTNDSLLKIRQMRCISKKRIRTNRKWDKLDIKWELEEKYHDEILTKIKIMFWI